MTLVANQVPAHVILVAAVLFHREEPEDRKDAPDLETPVVFDCFEGGILGFGIEIRETTVSLSEQPVAKAAHGFEQVGVVVAEDVVPEPDYSGEESRKDFRIDLFNKETSSHAQSLLR